MKVSELSKLLKKNGCYLVKHGKEHDEWYSEITRKSFRLPRHERDSDRNTKQNFKGCGA